MKKKEAKIKTCGRIVLLGEHSDWAGRYCILSAVEKGITGQIGTREDNKLVVFSEIWGETFKKTYTLNNLSHNDVKSERDVLMYFPAVARVLLDDNYPIGGLEISCKTDLPVKKGLASSAAICILIVKAFDRVYNLGLDEKTIIDITFRAENLLGIKCGKMDQAAIIYHKHPIFINFKEDPFTIENIIPSNRFYFVVGNCLGTKDTESILENLSNALFQKSGSEKEKKYKIASHYFWELLPELVLRGKKILYEGKVKEFGELMREAQQLYDEYMMPLSPEELKAPKMHDFLEIIRNEGSVGEKWSGSGGDGAFLALSEDEVHQQQLIKTIRENHGEAFGLTLS